MKHSSHFFPTTNRLGHRAFLLVLLLLLGGCAVTPPRVDPYSTLLPAGRKVVDAGTRVSAADLKNETAYLVVGANFNTYAEVWGNFQATVEKPNFSNMVYSREFLLDGMAQWAPTRVTSLVVTELQKHFRKIVIVNDLAEAQDRKAKWIVMFDHAYVQTSTATATWANTTSIDLLDSNFRRVVAVAFSEHKDYGGAWRDGDNQRFMVNRGKDIVRSVQTALGQFNTKLTAAH